MSKEPVIVFLAAGMGSRFGGPKQITPLGPNGEIILDYSCYDAWRAGFRKAVFIVKRSMEQDFREIVARGIARKMDYELVYQDMDDLPEGYSIPEGREKPWGTSHALLAARNAVNGPFAVMNADDYYGPEAFQVVYDYLKQDHPASPLPMAMVGYQLKNVMSDKGSVARGICQQADGYLTDIVEHTKLAWQPDGSVSDALIGDTVPTDSLCSMNFWGLPAGIMDELMAGFPAFLDKALAENPMKGEYLLPSSINTMIHEGRAECKVLTSHDSWFGVTYKEDAPLVQESLRALHQSGVYPEKGLWL